MKIHIPEPCSEDFQKMPLQDKGRYCAICQKCVIDFRKMSHVEIKDYLLKNANACGTFYPKQIEQFNKENHTPWRLPYGSNWIPAGLLALFAGVFNAQQNQEFMKDSTLHEEMKVVLSQNNNSIAKKPQISTNSTKIPLVKNAKVKKTIHQSDSIFTARGTILQEDNLPLVGVLVYNKNQIDKGVITNKNGEFSIQVKLGDTLVMEFENSSTLTYDINSYNSIHIIFSNSNNLDDETILIGEIVRYRKFPNNVFHTLSFPYRKIRNLIRGF